MGRNIDSNDDQKRTAMDQLRIILRQINTLDENDLSFLHDKERRELVINYQKLDKKYREHYLDRLLYVPLGME